MYSFSLFQLNFHIDVQNNTQCVNATAHEHTTHSKKTIAKKSSVKRSYNMPTIQHYIDDAFKNELQKFIKNETQLKKGDAVLARMKGFDPWPARIVDFSNNQKIAKCFFFGTNNIGPVGTKNIILFANAFETVRLICLRNPNCFVKGVREIEIESGIPNEFSCLREYKAIE